MNRLYINRDWSTLKKLLALKAAGGGSVPQTETATGSLVTFDTTKALPLIECEVGIEPVQEGSGDPSPENVRPITGWTGAKVYRTGKNLCDPAKLDGTKANFIWGYRGTGFLFKAGISYTLSTGKEVDSIRIVSLDEQTVLAQGSSGIAGITYTPATDTLGVIRLWSTGLTLDGINFLLELGSTATAYEPYTGQTVNVQFPSEAGTVYGGTLDVINGVLTAETVYREFDGSSDEAWEGTGASGTTSQVFLLPWADVRGATFDGKTIICNQALETDSSGDPAYGFCKNSSVHYNIRVNIMPTAVLLTEFRAYLSQHPLQIVCPLVTPLTYQLTPQQISTLRGENNIWSDAGDVTVTYTK